MPMSMDGRWSAATAYHSERETAFARAAHVLAAFACALALVAAAPARAATVSTTNLWFNQLGLNPWAEGPAHKVGGDYSFGKDFDVRLPTQDLSPWGLLASAVGIDLPRIGFVSAGATIRGDASLNFGYSATGGELNVTYPGRASVLFPTVSGTNNVLASGTLRSTTSFTPGLTTTIPVTRSNLCDRGGLGYCGGTPSLARDLLTVVSTPEFRTTFPFASAYARFDYDLGVGLVVEGGVLKGSSPLGDYCLFCFEKPFTVNREGSIRFLDANPSGIEIIGLGRQNLFGQQIPVGDAGTIRVDYPNLQVEGALDGGSFGLKGVDAAPIITLNAQLEKLLPFVGPFLSNSIGPFNYTLAEFSGGPVFGLYQDFTLDVTPTVELLFSRPVEWFKDGARIVTDRIKEALGNVIEWRPTLYTAELTVQPVYSLEAKFRNETGFTLGYQGQLDVLKVGAGPATLGPINVASFNEDAAVRLAKIYEKTFDVPFASIAGQAQTFQVRSPFVNSGTLAAVSITGVEPFDGGCNRGPGTGFIVAFRTAPVDVLGLQSGGSGFALGCGRLERLPSGQEVFVTDEDVIASVGSGFGNTTSLATLNLGRAFCVGVCADRSVAFAELSPVLELDNGESLLFTRLGSAIPELQVCTGGGFACIPELNVGASRRIDLASDVVGPTLDTSFGTPPADVPEPSTAALLLLGLTGLGWLSSRRRAGARAR